MVLARRIVCVVARKRWSELDPGVRTAIMLGGAVEAGLKIAALIDLALQPPSAARGSKAGGRLPSRW